MDAAARAVQEVIKMAEKRIDLHPCPFCGRRPKMCIDSYNKYAVICSCGVMIGIDLEDNVEFVDGWTALFETVDEATKAWNSRIGVF